jgi:hypothetical protein
MFLLRLIMLISLVGAPSVAFSSKRVLTCESTATIEVEYAYADSFRFIFTVNQPAAGKDQDRWFDVNSEHYQHPVWAADDRFFGEYFVGSKIYSGRIIYGELEDENSDFMVQFYQTNSKTGRIYIDKKIYRLAGNVLYEDSYIVRDVTYNDTLRLTCY